MEVFIQKVIRGAGELAMEFREKLDSIEVEKKGSEKDLVTEADKAVEQYIRNEISNAYPEHAVLGEEQGATGEHDYRWIIDPIDGTVAFLHGQYFFSISIALSYKGETILGAVYAPALDDLFSAAKGKGAFLNGKPVRVSSRDSLVNSICCTGYDCRDGILQAESLKIFNRVMPYLRDIRRYGSAALDLCLVACGQLEGYWEQSLQLYDVAAGLLILEEAGGLVSDYKGGEAGMPAQVVGTNGLIHRELVNLISAE